MIQIEASLVTWLKANSTVSGLLGDRIFPGQAPQINRWPIMTYAQSSLVQMRSLAGLLNLYEYTWEATCHAGDYAGAREAYLAVRSALLSLQHAEDNAVIILGVFEGPSSESDIPPVQADEYGIFQASLNFRVYFVEK